MKHISRHIAELLYFNDCVIIPGFGGFIANYKSSVINNTNDFFIPPRKHIVFNKNLKENDGLLINTICRRQNIEYKEAGQQVENYIKHIKNQLNVNKKYFIESIGTFFLDSRNNLTFEADTNVNLYIDAYGLESFHFPKLETDKQIKHIKEKFKNKESVKQSIHHPVTKKILIGLPLAMFLAIMPFKTNIIDKHYFSEANILNNLKYSTYDTKLENPDKIQYLIENIANKEKALLYVEPQQKTNNTNQRTVLIEEEKIEKTSTKPEKKDIVTQQPEDKYFIIAGSFTKIKRAEKFCKEMVSKGFSPVILEKQNGRIRISIGSFAHRNEANSYLDEYKQKSELDLWILTKNI